MDRTRSSCSHYVNDKCVTYTPACDTCYQTVMKHCGKIQQREAYIRNAPVLNRMFPNNTGTWHVTAYDSDLLNVLCSKYNL